MNSSDTATALTISIVAALLSALALAQIAFFPYIRQASRAHWMGIAMILPIVGAFVWFVFATFKRAQVHDLIERLTNE